MEDEVQPTAHWREKGSLYVIWNYCGACILNCAASKPPPPKFWAVMRKPPGFSKIFARGSLSVFWTKDEHTISELNSRMDACRKKVEDLTKEIGELSVKIEEEMKEGSMSGYFLFPPQIFKAYASRSVRTSSKHGVGCLL